MNENLSYAEQLEPGIYGNTDPGNINAIINSLASGMATGQLVGSAPGLAKGALSFLKGLGNAGEIGLGGATEGAAGVKAVNQGLKALTVPDELAEVQAVLAGVGKSYAEGVTAFIKGFQKGVNGEQIPIYGVKGPAEALKALFGDAAPGSVPESVLIAKGLLPGAAQKGMAADIMAQKALNLAEDTGGATFNMTKGNLAGTGHYAVAVYPERELILKGEASTKQIEQYIAKNQDLLNDPSNSLGIWKDTETGQTYLDVTKTLADKEEAMKLGLEKAQKAIFNLKDMSEIRLPARVGIGSFGGTKYSVPEDILTKYIDTIVAPTKGISKQQAFSNDLLRSQLHDQLTKEALSPFTKPGMPSFEQDMYGNVRRMISNFGEDIATQR